MISDSSKPLGMSFVEERGGRLLDKRSSWLLHLAAIGCCCQYRILFNLIACAGSRPLTGFLLQVSLEYAVFRCVDSNLKPIRKATGNKRSHQGAGKSRISLPWFVRLRTLFLTLHSLGEWGWWGGGCVDWY